MQVQLKLFYIVILMYCSITLKQIQFILQLSSGPHFEALADIENELKDSSLNYTIIKPSFFMDNFLRITKVENGEIMIPEFINQDVKFAMISSIDIARIASNVFGNPEKYNHQAIEIASDELTLKEVVKTFAMVTGKPTEIKGSFSSGTAERGWLEEKVI